MPNIIVYTCVTNNYDWVLPPIWRSPNVRFVCFTDNPKMKVKAWEVRPLPSVPNLGNGNLANRYCKFFPWYILPEHDWSIYIDANIRLLTDPTPIVNEAEGRGCEIALFAHPDRSNIWEEAEACKHLRKVQSEESVELDEQLRRYAREGMSHETALTANYIIFRPGDPTRIMPVMKLWWEELLSGVKRDQISLPYILWRTNTPVYRIPLASEEHNPFFRRVSHRRGGGVFGYVGARRHHNIFWQSLYQVMKVLSGARKRSLGIFRVSRK